MSFKHIRPQRRGIHLATAEAGTSQALAAIHRRGYARALMELDRALTALEQDGVAVCELRRRWNRLALSTWCHPGPAQRVYAARSEIIKLFCAVARHVQRRRRAQEVQRDSASK